MIRHHQQTVGGLMGFVQIIELRTSRFEEVEALHDAWLAETEGARTTISETVVADREHPGRYLVIVEFPDEAAAAVNNDLEATGRFAEKLTELLDEPPVFSNMDLVRVDRT
ncbi:putative quinol monooxygenase [Aquihabitans daechungensis]|uniref:putative quinol monooxygenase n=1 Tax=Aquihabitans daechungensis TaxID=1052257 RepID=UPI003B9FEB8D